MCVDLNNFSSYFSTAISGYIEITAKTFAKGLWLIEPCKKTAGCHVLLKTQHREETSVSN